MCEDIDFILKQTLTVVPCNRRRSHVYVLRVSTLVCTYSDCVTV